MIPIIIGVCASSPSKKNPYTKFPCLSIGVVEAAAPEPVVVEAASESPTLDDQFKDIVERITQFRSLATTLLADVKRLQKNVGKHVRVDGSLNVVGDVAIDTRLFVSNDASFSSKLYVVDDACPEGTADYVETNFKEERITVLRHTYNEGVGAAVLTGYRHALQDEMTIVVKLDGDAQMDPKKIPAFISSLETVFTQQTLGLALSLNFI